MRLVRNPNSHIFRAVSLARKVIRGHRRAHLPRTPLAKARPMKVNVYVTLKPGVLDPQGKAIHHALEGLGFGGVADVRAGRFIELDVADGTSDADLDAMCAKLLANTVIENYRIERP
jgi:phosphoribosylformylglycinamidine synthase PurS subunit